MKELEKKAMERKDALIGARRRLHGFAECGFDLSQTRDFITTALKSMGYAPRDLGRGGIAAETETKDPRAPVVLLRADMDALPLREETRLPFRAENGCAHACGHDLHTAMLLGAASLLAEGAPTPPFRVRFVFQAAEETLSGARELLTADVLSGVLAAFSLHVVPALPYPTGTVLLPQAGIGAPAAAFFTLHIKGESAHVGEKSRGKDAIACAWELYRRIHEEAARIGEDFSLLIGKMRAGDAPNVVAGHATLAGSFRSKNEEMLSRFHAFLLTQTERSGGAVTLSFSGACPPLLNDGRLIGAMQTALQTAGIPYVSLPSSGGAAEDFAHFATRVPSLMLAVAAGEKARGYERPLHHPAVLFDEDVLPRGAALYAMAAHVLGSL